MRQFKAKAQADWGTNKDPLEKNIEKAVKDYARSLGVLVRKWKSPNRRSVPDDLFFFDNGVLLIVEFKRGKKVPTKAQQNEIDKLLEKKFFVRVVDNKEMGKLLIRNFYDYANRYTK